MTLVSEIILNVINDTMVQIYSKKKYIDDLHMPVYYKISEHANK